MMPTKVRSTLYTVQQYFSEQKFDLRNSSCSKPCLFLSDSLVHVYLDSIQGYTKKHFARYWQQGYTARIITYRNIPFLWYFHYQTLPQIICYQKSFTFVKIVYQFLQCTLFLMLYYLTRNIVTSKLTYTLKIH